MTVAPSPAAPSRPVASPTLGRCLLEALVVAVVAVTAAVVVNLARPDGLPFIATIPYQTLVPCPEPGGPVVPITPGDPEIASQRTFLVDARSAAEHAAGHLPGAVSLPYDWLDPVPEEDLRRVAERIAASRATQVVVYGDGGRPDSGEHLGREISGRGIKNVHVLVGGAPAVLDLEGR